MNTREAVARLKELSAEIKTWHGIDALLGWDQETYMPEKAIGGRSKQQSAVSSLIHEKTTAPEIGRLLELLGADEANERGDESRCSDLSFDERALIRGFYRGYSKATKLPAKLVAELSETQSLAQSAWAKARSNDDFAAFQPHLEKIIDLKLQCADAYGYDQHPYDSLLDEYEPGMKTAEVDQVFGALRSDLVSLVADIARADQVDNSFLTKHYPASKQEEFSRIVMKALSYSDDRGRLDISAHPFTTELGADDIRITTRFLEDFFNSALFSTVHEVGHGLYELGIGEEYRGGILATGTSLGIHESQSRTWENIVGRSREFWEHFLPIAQKIFPENLQSVELDQMWRAVNRVEPSFVRVEADEVTYGLHIMLRFELEKKLIAKELSVKDIPEAWNETTRELLGIVPSNNAEGCLQDVHWSFGLFGYFPTYALGNLYGSQFWNAMTNQIGDQGANMSAGNFAPILSWLREHIHRHGSAKTAGEIAIDVTGESLNAKYFVNYLKDKYARVYRF